MQSCSILYPWIHTFIHTIQIYLAHSKALQVSTCETTSARALCISAFSPGLQLSEKSQCLASDDLNWFDIFTHIQWCCPFPSSFMVFCSGCYAALLLEISPMDHRAKVDFVNLLLYTASKQKGTKSHLSALRSKLRNCGKIWMRTYWTSVPMCSCKYPQSTYLYIIS